MTARNSIREVRKKKGLIFVVTAPSGAGKTTLCRALVKNFPTIKYTISYTTRQPRAGEIPGQHYHFITKDEFESMIRRGLFSEWAEVYGNFYGTLVKDMEELNSAGYDVLMDIDTGGAMQIREKFKEAVLIFICPPSLSILEKRLLKRGTDSTDIVKERLKKVYEEVSYLEKFDYMVVNDDQNSALKELESIVASERLRISRVNSLWVDNFLKDMNKEV